MRENAKLAVFLAGEYHYVYDTSKLLVIIKGYFKISLLTNDNNGVVIIRME